MRKVAYLASPFDAISVRAEQLDWGVLLTYVAPSLEALVTAGCITEEMRASFGERKPGKGRVDEHGDNFVRYKIPRKNRPTQVRLVRYIHSVERAKRLPGVVGVLQSFDEARSSVLETKVSKLMQATGSGRFSKPRRKRFGRFWKTTEWFTLENCIFIDWPAIQSAVRVQRAIANHPELSA